MRVHYGRGSIYLVPENLNEVAFIEDTLGCTTGRRDALAVERIEAKSGEFGFCLDISPKNKAGKPR
jgi:hypothetical protein